jgi:beta-lactamase class A
VDGGLDHSAEAIFLRGECGTAFARPGDHVHIELPERSSSAAQEALDRVSERLERLEREAHARALGVAVYDTESGATLTYHADRWFHAASTIKVAILAGVYAAIHEGRWPPHARLHVRNRFLSAVDGSVFRVSAERDANAEVHAAIGKMMRVRELAHHMITTSSNLATNLLLDLVGVETVQGVLEHYGIQGIDFRRGVEDERSFAAGISNRVTARGLMTLLRTIEEEKVFSPQLSREMLDILHQQEFRNGIPGRLPREVRVAHKTGDISTIAHDAGIVYPRNRKPYIIAILTEWDPDTTRRSAAIATVSQEIYQALTSEARDG